MLNRGRTIAAAAPTLNKWANLRREIENVFIAIPPDEVVTRTATKRETEFRVVEALAAASACLFSSVLENKHRYNTFRERRFYSNVRFSRDPWVPERTTAKAA
jgi:hypothetical protein